MRTMVFDRYGEPDVMRLRDVPVPEPQEDEVLIRVGYAGVNPADSKARAGHSARAGFRYQDVREINRLIDGGLVHIPPIDVLPLEDAARAHQMIDIGHVR